MGTVGINFGSATSGAGFDVAGTVTAIQSAQASIETPWKSQLSALTSQDTALTTIGTDLSTLTTSLQALTDFTGVTAQKNGSSSDNNTLALTGATSTAVAGSHTITVNTLAQTSSNYSDSVVHANDVLGGSIAIQVGGGTAQTVSVGSGSNTLSTLSAAINSAALGVSASVITDANGSRLSLVSGTSGAAGQLTISGNLTDTTTGGSAVGFHVGEPGTNAALTVDGVSVVSASNTVSSAIPGVTFQLLAASANPVQVQITNDTASVSTAVSTFVSSYNAVVKDLGTQEGKDATGAYSPLHGSQTLALIQNQLSASIFGGAPSGSINSLTQLGVTFGTNGTLSVNTDTLTTALTDHFSDIVGFLQNSGSFGQSFATALNSLGTQAPTGAVYVTEQQNAAQEKALNANIANEDTLLANQKIVLTAELNTANQELQAIPSQLNQVNEIYSAVTGYSKVQNG